MKKFLLAVVFVGLKLSVSAQLPTILAHTIIPTNPTSSSQIKIVTHLQTNSSAFGVDKHFTVTPASQHVRLRLCYADGMLTVISHHIDTFAIGQLPQGVYAVQLSAYMSSAGQHCAKVDSNFAAYTFTVSGPVGLQKNVVQNKTKIFPNPAHDYITIESTDKKIVRIFSMQGQLVRVGETSSSGSFSLQELSAGMYLLEILSSKEKEVHRIIVN